MTGGGAERTQFKHFFSPFQKYCRITHKNLSVRFEQYSEAQSGVHSPLLYPLSFQRDNETRDYVAIGNVLPSE